MRNKYREFVLSRKGRTQDSNPQEEMEYQELRHLIDATLARMPERRLRIFRMHRMEGKKYAEIASQLSLSVKTVEAEMTKALKALKKEILKIKEIHKKYPNALISLCEPLTIYGNECTGGTKSKHIYYDGKIYPCTITCGHKDFLIGDVDSGISIKRVGDLQKKSQANNSICSECDLLQFCSGARCKYISKVITGSFLQPAPIDCNWTRLIYEINGCGF